MKKFVGLVNGKSFDNKEDFNYAVNEAVRENDGNLSISSYYSYTQDNDNSIAEGEVKDSNTAAENTESVKKKDSENTESVQKKDSESTESVQKKEYVKYDDYHISGGKSVMVDNAYPVTDDLKKKIMNASNYAEIKDEVRRSSKIYKKLIGDKELSIDKDKSFIKQLEDELRKDENVLKEYKARYAYYNDIYDLMKEKDEKEDLDDTSLSSVERYNTYLPLSIYSFFKDMGLF